MKVAIINGPNLNLLGERDPAIYGVDTLADIEQRLEDQASEYGFELSFFQSNSESAIIDRLQEARLDCGAVILNAGAYTHYSYAIRDAIEAIRIPVIEVHLSNVSAREEFRRSSVIAPVCRGSIIGFGSASYTLALAALLELND